MQSLHPTYISKANLNKPSILDETDYEAVKSSVYQIQCLTGDETDLADLSIEQLLKLQKKLEQSL